MKQVPLLCIMMTSKRKQDYKAVLQKVKDLLPKTTALNKVFSNFKSAVWKAFPSVFPEVLVKGCCFQAL